MGAEADELPGAHADLQDERHSYRDLPVRYCEAGLRAPPRAVAARSTACCACAHRPGRRAHLLHRGAGPGRGRRLPATSASTSTGCSASSRASSSRRAPRSGSAPTRCGTTPRRRSPARSTRPGARVRAQPWRRRLLRAEDRPAHDRLDRALVAARHRPARLLDARALRPDLHGRRQRRAPAGDDPPRAARLLRALHRHPDRALRRRAAGLAGAGAGDRAADRRPPERGRAAACSRRCARPACAASSTSARSRSAARSATPSCARFPYMLVVGEREAAAGDGGRARARRRRRGRRRDRRVRRRGCALESATSGASASSGAHRPPTPPRQPPPPLYSRLLAIATSTMPRTHPA